MTFITPTPSQLDVLYRALQIIAGQDDGAYRRDHCGFNRDDTDLGNDLAALDPGEWSDDEVNEVSRMCIYYQRQYRDEIPEAIDVAKALYQAPPENEITNSATDADLEALNSRDSKELGAAIGESIHAPLNDGLRHNTQSEPEVGLRAAGDNSGDNPGPSAPQPQNEFTFEEKRAEAVADYDYDVLAEAADEIDLTPKNITVEFLTGIAGTGKTFEIKRRIREDQRYGILCATTGIAAVNLDSITINSLLKYFDTDSLQDQYLMGRLTHYMRIMGFKRIVIDEVSMMAAEQLDLIYKAACEAGVSLVLTGDFCQLPPIKARWAFEADCWPIFESHTTRLSKIWRQDNAQFLEALNKIRSGHGAAGVNILRQLTRFWNAAEIGFQGTTILAKNLDVDRHNDVSLLKVQGADIRVPSQRWGKCRGEWKHIPEVLRVRVGAYVMILTNEPETFSYVNGDCGWVKQYDPDRRVFYVQLKRNNQVVAIPELVRNMEQKEQPDYACMDIHDASEFWKEPGGGRSWLGHYYSRTSEKLLRSRWILGQVKYFPLRLAYAATVHKTQGLTLDAVQIDTRNAFFGNPAMVYVALSRCRTPEGLRLVGTPEVMAKRVSVDPKVLQWL